MDRACHLVSFGWLAPLSAEMLWARLCGRCASGHGGTRYARNNCEGRFMSTDPCDACNGAGRRRRAMRCLNDDEAALTDAAFARVREVAA